MRRDAFPREHQSPRASRWSRREFLHAAGLALALPAVGRSAGEPQKRLKVAAVFTAFFHRSHAHVLIENFLQPYLFNGKRTDPGVEIVSLYADQRPQRDMAQEISRQFQIPIYETIDGALCRGGKELAVDAVLSIGEHGRYPVNQLGQMEYPRKRFFDEIVAVMRRSQRFVPLFNDKHLSYRWDWAKEMVDTAQQLGIPFLAGSSVPLAQRIPPLELPPQVELTEALAIHGGPVESYDFHGLEVLQSLVEARKGGETGIARIEFVRGEALWQAAEKGRWSLPLAEAAMAAEFGKKLLTLQRIEGERPVEPHGLLLTYKDGLRAAVLKIGQSSIRWSFACFVKGEPKPQATYFYPGPWQNRNLFKALAHAIQHHFQQGKAPYPIERTLLTTGALQAAMQARLQGQSLPTPHLEFAYTPRDFRALREMGATWKIITQETPEPTGIKPVGINF
jgi:hypothetical protein